MNTLARSLVAASLCAASARSQVLFFDDFESGTSAWTMDAPWHLASESDSCASGLAPFPSAAHCMWYGQEGSCTYFGAPYGCCLTLTTPVHLPSGARSAWLRYKNVNHLENYTETYDSAAIQVSVDAGAHWSTVGQDRGEPYPHPIDPWHRSRVDLRSFLGQDVRVRWYFFHDGFDDFYFGWMIDDVEIQVEPGAPFCEQGFGCPCGNHQAWYPGSYTYDVFWGGGCVNSRELPAELSAVGSATVANDTVVLRVTDLPLTTTCFFVQGTATSSGATFGDGLRCIGGTLVRLGPKTAVNGVATYPAAGDPPISVAGAIQPGSTRTYQARYRDAAPFCTVATFNQTNGYEIDWQ